MPFMTVFYRKHLLCVTITLFFGLLLFGCGGSKPLFGTTSPPMALAEAKAALTRAEELEAETHAPMEIDRAKKALSKAQKTWSKWSKYKGGADSTGSPNTDEEIIENAGLAKLYAEIAHALSSQKRIEQQINQIEKKRLRYDSLKKQHQLEEARTKAFIEEQQKLKAERQVAELKALQETHAKQVAELRALKEAKAKEEAQKRTLEETRAKEMAQKRTLEEIRAKEEAQMMALVKDKARKEALLEKILAELAEQEALKAKDKAQKRTLEETRAKEMAQQEALAAKQKLWQMQEKLSLLSSEFAKVKEEKRGLVVTLSDILFDVNKATIQAGAAKNLEYLANIIKEYPNRKILVEGHTDSSGSEEYNMTLSEERAFAVMGYLMTHGTNAKMMEAKGYGESKPVTNNDTPEGRQQNRRVDIVILNPNHES